jgi:hypothetical protein
MTTQMSNDARQARNNYQRQYRRKNPDKIKQYNVNYWERKAAAIGEPLEVRILKLHRQGFSLRSISAKVGINHVKVSRILQCYK